MATYHFDRLTVAPPTGLGKDHRPDWLDFWRFDHGWLYELNANANALAKKQRESRFNEAVDEWLAEHNYARTRG